MSILPVAGSANPSTVPSSGWTHHSSDPSANSQLASEFRAGAGSAGAPGLPNLPATVQAKHHQHERRGSHDHSPAPGSFSDSQWLNPAGLGSDTGDGSAVSPQPKVQPDHGITIPSSYPSPPSISELQRGGSAGQRQASIATSQTTQNSTAAPDHQHERRGPHATKPKWYPYTAHNPNSGPSSQDPYLRTSIPHVPSQLYAYQVCLSTLPREQC
jgi:hypothetical protein